METYTLAIKIISSMSDEEVCEFMGVNFYDIDEYAGFYDLRYHATIQKAEELEREQNIVA